jgi:hypothetical protein
VNGLEAQVSQMDAEQAAIDRAEALSGVQDDSAALAVICWHFTDRTIAITPDFLAATVGNFLKEDANRRISGKDSRVPHPLPGVASRLEVCASGIEVVYPGRFRLSADMPRACSWLRLGWAKAGRPAASGIPAPEADSRGARPRERPRTRQKRAGRPPSGPTRRDWPRGPEPRPSGMQC